MAIHQPLKARWGMARVFGVTNGALHSAYHAYFQDQLQGIWNI